MVKKRSDRVKDAFRLAKNERQGFLIIASICMVLVVWIYYEHNLRPVRTSSNLRVEYVEEGLTSTSLASGGSERQISELAPFDPNILDSAGWLGLGFSPKQTASILKYRRKGGSFRIKKDLAKLYVVDDGKYEQLEPFISLPTAIDRKQSRFKTTSTKIHELADPVMKKDVEQFRRLEINGAGVEELEALPHIGPKTAAQIISFRDLLGGFHNTRQLEEVYYLRDKPEAVNELLQLVEVDSSSVRRIPLNECEPAAFAEFDPLIDWKEANALVNYRNHHGDFGSVEGIKECKLITEELFRKIAPYLTVE